MPAKTATPAQKEMLAAFQRKIAMDEIPFAPQAYPDREITDAENRRSLADTIPPVEPPAAPLSVKLPTECRVVAWRHDGGLDDTKHATIESATAHALGLHWAIYWKYALQCGRDMIDRKLIIQPLPHLDLIAA